MAIIHSFTLLMWTWDKEILGNCRLSPALKGKAYGAVVIWLPSSMHECAEMARPQTERKEEHGGGGGDELKRTHVFAGQHESSATLSFHFLLLLCSYIP